jgi:hypothetical protein
MFRDSENFGRIVETVFSRTDRELPAGRAPPAPIDDDGGRVSRRCPMPAGAAIIRRTPSERAIIRHGGGSAIYRWLAFGHRGFGTLRSDSPRRAVEATPVRTTNPPSRRTGPLPSLRRDL